MAALRVDWSSVFIAIDTAIPVPGADVNRVTRIRQLSGAEGFSWHCA
jgi:hypothetical protein